MAFVARADGGTTGTLVGEGWSRWAPVTGIAFVVLFVVAFYINQAPGDGASNAEWQKTYSNSGNQVLFVVSGFMLVLASLCLLAFVHSLWMRIAAARRPQETSRLPRSAAGLAATSIALGAVLAATVPGTMIFRAHLAAGQLRLPSADILRLTAAAFFAFVSVAGMFGVALVIAGLGVQARSAGLFGRWFATTSIVVAILTLFSFGYYPMIAPMLWFLVVSIMLLRRNSVVGKSPTTIDSMAARAPTASAEQS
jgi:hypothetical protein